MKQQIRAIELKIAVSVIIDWDRTDYNTKLDWTNEDLIGAVIAKLVPHPDDAITIRDGVRFTVLVEEAKVR